MLEPASQAFVEATATPPFLYQLTPDEARKVLDDVQAEPIDKLDGPIVLVAHSYGGAVASEAATLVPNVKALVYLDALALEEGESNFDIAERFPSKILPALRPRPFPQADGSEGTDFYIDPASFRESSPRTCPPGPWRGWPRPSVPFRWRPEWRSRRHLPGRRSRPGT